jgi:hypothetical protein
LIENETRAGQTAHNQNKDMSYESPEERIERLEKNVQLMTTVLIKTHSAIEKLSSGQVELVKGQAQSIKTEYAILGFINSLGLPMNANIKAMLVAALEKAKESADSADKSVATLMASLPLLPPLPPDLSSN